MTSWRHNDVIIKTVAKFGPPRNQTKYTSFERYWWELSKNALFWVWTTMSKVMGIFYKFWPSYDARSPNVVMLRHPRSKFWKLFTFVQILHLISGIVIKFPVEKFSTSAPSAFKARQQFLLFLWTFCKFYSRKVNFSQSWKSYFQNFLG